MVTKKSQKIARKFVCKLCDYNTSNNSDFKKHIETQKHLGLQMVTHLSDTFNCICGKKYKYRQGLSRHKKTCVFFQTEEKNKKQREELALEKECVVVTNYSNDTNETIIEKQAREINELKSMFINVVNDNKDVHKLLLEQQKQISDMIPKIGDVNNHNKFNLNIFLNEKCKNAINLHDFIASLCVKENDLDFIKQNGFIKGVSNVFLKGLEDLDTYTRPVHCSDMKRKIMYIKEEEGWDKDMNNTKIYNAINHIGKKHIDKLKEWEDEHQGWEKDEKLSEEYMQLVKIITNNDKATKSGVIKQVATEVELKNIKL